MDNIKVVSTRFAKHDFMTVGLVLILYALIVLFVPFVLSFFLEIMNLTAYKGFDLLFYSRLICLVLGTVVPFTLLRYSIRKKQSSEAEDMELSEYFVNFALFFTTTSASLLIAFYLASFFNIKGSIIGGIGITVTDDSLKSIPFVLCFILISPLLEEFAFRGVLLNSLSRYGKYFALLASSLICALAHSSFVEMIPAFIMSLFLGKLVFRYRSVKPAIVLHILFELVLYLTFIATSYFRFLMYILLAIIYLLAVFFFIFRIYRGIIVRKTEVSKTAMILFLSSPSVLVAIVLFIVETILALILI